ncbi:MAG: type II toxin-antitoxin system RelE/ParE family toxin [Candidatus Vogelbacteria bacterium]|nr:type II toxin-antitoxin system RelE/ParE family toxin [Candidatus Vogelbacteria bacterium]
MSSRENWELHLDRSVEKILRRLPAQDRIRISLVISLLTLNLFSGDIQKMKGRNDVWRRRIGNYRLFCKIDLANRIIVVFDLERRTSSTY